MAEMANDTGLKCFDYCLFYELFINNLNIHKIIYINYDIVISFFCNL